MNLRVRVLQTVRRMRDRAQSGFERFLAAIRWQLIWDRVSGAGWTHWLGVLAALLLGLLASHRLQREASWQQVRYFGHRLTERLPSDPLTAGRTVVVMIDDEEYASQLNSTSPIDRSYLAKLIDAIRGDDREPKYENLPHVIAVDVALTKPPSGDPYGNGTLALSQSIAKLPRTTKVALTYRVSGGPERFTRQPGLLDGMSNVIFGCATLTEDKTRLGLTIPLDDGKEHDTFATAIARAVDPMAIAAREQKAREGSLVTSFLARESIPIIRAADVRERKPEVLARLAHKIVIIGGNWHESATGRMTDLHRTPFGGDWSGAVLNASYVEALLAPNATKKPMSGRFNVLMEILATIAVSLIFVVVLRGALRFLTLLLVALGVITASVIIFQNFGGFFDCSVVLFFLGIHALIERSGSPHSNRRRSWAFATTAVTCILASYFLYRQAQEPVPVYDIEDVAQVAKLTIESRATDLEVEAPLPVPPPSSPLLDVAPEVRVVKNEEPSQPSAPKTPKEIFVLANDMQSTGAPEENEVVVTSTEAVVDIATSTSPVGTQVPQFLTLPPSSLVHYSAHGIAGGGQWMNLGINGASGGENAYILDSNLCAPERTTQNWVGTRPLESVNLMRQMTMQKDRVGISSFAPLRNSRDEFQGWERGNSICVGIK